MHPRRSAAALLLLAACSLPQDPLDDSEPQDSAPEADTDTDVDADSDADADADADADSDADTDALCEGAVVCSTLADLASVQAAGLTYVGGNFRDGGWAVDAQGDQINARVGGEFSVGTVRFEAKDLLVLHEYEDWTHGCERFIWQWNRDDSPRRSYSANMAHNCGSERGNLRFVMQECCADTAKVDNIPGYADDQWHDFAWTWDSDRIRIWIDGVEHASASQTISPGSDPYLELGSEDVSGDQVEAVFRNLRIYDTVIDPTAR